MVKRILGIVLLMSMFFSGSFGRMQETIVYADTTVSEEKAYVIIEEENVNIDGHHYEHIKYFRNAGQTIRIISIKTKEDKLIIPAEIDDLQVVEIGGTGDELGIVDGREYDTLSPWMFDEGQVFEKIIVPEGVVQIVSQGFRNAKAKCIELPKSLESIGNKEDIYDSCFVDAQIDQVIVKGKKTELMRGAFADSGIKKITLPKNFQGKIGSSAFKNSKLEKFVWPSYKGDVTKKIDYQAFAKCKNLKKVVFPKNQKHIYIPEACFWGCTKLKKLTFPASTKKVTYSSSAYADNYKKGVGALVLKGKKTKLVGCEYKRGNKCKVFVTVGKIIAPKKSKALAVAKRAKRIKWIATGVQKDLDVHTSPSENFSELGTPSVKFAKMRYSVLKK